MSEPLDTLGLPIVGDYLVEKGRAACGHDEVGIVIFMHDNISGKIVCTTNFPPQEFDSFMAFVSAEDYSTTEHKMPPKGSTH